VSFLDPVQISDSTRDVAMATNFVLQAKHKHCAIFAIFTQYESILGVDDRSEICFSISKATLPPAYVAQRAKALGAAVQ